MRLLICSDIHFFAPHWSPLQLFSKECIGNLNALFSRIRDFSPSHIESLLGQISTLDITHAIILGDFTTTSSKKEFALAQQFITRLQNKGVTVMALPGNHDHYTKEASSEQRFYYRLEDLLDFQGDSPKGVLFSKDKVVAYELESGTWLICLDTTLKTPPFHSWGLFSQEIEERLQQILSYIPKNHQIIVANHFPLITKKGHYNCLRRRERLKEILRGNPSVRFYLSGHEHRYEDQEIEGLRLLNPGSLTLRKRAGFLILDSKGKVEKHDLV
jgi:3',5'-cyclic AMP phosphodiesterase CpdA